MWLSDPSGDEVFTTLSPNCQGPGAWAGLAVAETLSLLPPAHFNWDVGSSLPQAMKVLSKKKLIRQAGFPRKFHGPGGPLFLGTGAGVR